MTSHQTRKLSKKCASLYIDVWANPMDPQSLFSSHREDTIIPKIAFELRTVIINVMSQLLRLDSQSARAGLRAQLICAVSCGTAIQQYLLFQATGISVVKRYPAPSYHHFGFNESNTDPMFMKLGGKTGSYYRTEANYCYTRLREPW